MCVAVLVESDCPTRQELEWMEEENPHGAGIAWAAGNHIRYRKGLTAGQVWALAKSLPRPFLLHFRWATHGPRVPRLAHPFPLGYKAITSQSLRGKASAVLIHNGVWSAAEKKAPTWIHAYPEVSDTAIAALLAAEDESILDDVNWATAVGRAAGNGRMDVTLRGTWSEHNGNLYSNFNWKPRNRWSYAESGYQTGWAFDDDSIGKSYAEWAARQDRKDMIRQSVTGYLAAGKHGYEDCPVDGCCLDKGHKVGCMRVDGSSIRTPRLRGSGRIVDTWPIEELTLPIGIEDIPEETPQEVRDQLLTEDKPRRIADFFAEHAEVQAALAQMEGKCAVEGCVKTETDHRSHFNANRRFIGYTKTDGTLVTWDASGKMHHLYNRPTGRDDAGSEGCE